jgi:hypothetical protein
MANSSGTPLLSVLTILRVHLDTSCACCGVARPCRLRVLSAPKKEWVIFACAAIRSSHSTQDARGSKDDWRAWAGRLCRSGSRGGYSDTLAAVFRHDKPAVKCSTQARFARPGGMALGLWAGVVSMSNQGIHAPAGRLRARRRRQPGGEHLHCSLGLGRTPRRHSGLDDPRIPLYPRAPGAGCLGLRASLRMVLTSLLFGGRSTRSAAPEAGQDLLSRPFTCANSFFNNALTPRSLE